MDEKDKHLIAAQLTTAFYSAKNGENNATMKVEDVFETFVKFLEKYEEHQKANNKPGKVLTF